MPSVTDNGRGRVGDDSSMRFRPPNRWSILLSLRFGGENTCAVTADLDISERVIFPVTGSQSNGIEDARYDRDKAERARSKFVELQVLIDTLDRAISGEEGISATS